MKIYGEKWAGNIVSAYEKSEPRVRLAIDQFSDWEIESGHWETPDKAKWFIRCQMIKALQVSSCSSRWETFKQALKNKLTWQVAYNTVVRNTCGKVVNSWGQNHLTFE